MNIEIEIDDEVIENAVQEAMDYQEIASSIDTDELAYAMTIDYTELAAHIDTDEYSEEIASHVSINHATLAQHIPIDSIQSELIKETVKGELDELSVRIANWKGHFDDLDQKVLKRLEGADKRIDFARGLNDGMLKRVNSVDKDYEDFRGAVEDFRVATVKRLNSLEAFRDVVLKDRESKLDAIIEWLEKHEAKLVQMRRDYDALNDAVADKKPWWKRILRRN